MTRLEYLNQFKNNLSKLSEDETNKMVQYYSDYFEDANDDEKVMAELGTPENLAKTVLERVESKLEESTKNDISEQITSEKSYKPEGALFFSYNKESVKNLSFNFGAAEVVAICDDKISIETRGISEDNLSCNLSSDGTLFINNTKKINLNFLSHDRQERIVPRILLTIPSKMVFEKIKISIGAGSFESKGTDFSYKNGTLEVGAGSLILKNITGGHLNIRCGMGYVHLEGKIKEQSDIDCGMGSVRVYVKGKSETYSYDAKVGLGDFKFNEIKKSGVGQISSDSKKDNHFSVNCGMGSVKIKIEE